MKQKIKINCRAAIVTYSDITKFNYFEDTGNLFFTVKEGKIIKFSKDQFIGFKLETYSEVEEIKGVVK